MAPRTRVGFIEPMLLLRTDKLPDDPARWSYQLKLDGYRAIAFKTGGKVHLRSRNDNDFSARYAKVVRGLEKLPNETVIDGELIALADDERPSFNALQNYGSANITRATSAARVAAAQTRVTVSARTRATCSWSTSTRGLEREHVHYHGHDYTLRGSETRTLTTVGAFRAVPASDLRDSFDQPLDPRHGELWHLRDSGLVQTVRLDRDHSVVTLTKEGRDLLESRRLDEDSRERQAFHAGVPKPRELKHDAELYRAYTEEAERTPSAAAHFPVRRLFSGI